jgi:hypothetical protein
LPVQQRLEPRLPPGLPFGPLICLLAPIALIRAPTNLLWYAIALYNQLPCLLTTERCPIGAAVKEAKKSNSPMVHNGNA